MSCGVDLGVVGYVERETTKELNGLRAKVITPIKRVQVSGAQDGPELYCQRLASNS